MCHKQSLQLAGLLVAAVLVCNQGPAQTPDKQPTTGKSFYSQLNEQARIERSGDASAIPVVAHGAFENLGIPTDIADAFGLTARIVHAQQSYRAGTQPAAHEEDLVKAWNNFANSLGAPAWAHTTKPEIRKLRMRMLVVLPQLFACQEPPDAKGHYRVLSPNMSPLVTGDN